MKKLGTILFLCLSAASYAQTEGLKKILINPAETGPGIEKVHSPHLAMYNTQVKNNHKLFVMIVGTGGSATDLAAIDSFAAGLGYRTLSIDYKNNVITTVCNNSKDSACFDNFRQEIMFGTPVSDTVHVDTANSLVNRLYYALQWLSKNDAAGGWAEFIKGPLVQWDKVMVGGHSQGAGHAAFIGKNFKVYRVLMFSGPQDYRVTFTSPALWLSRPGKTPVNRYYAFLHLKDQFIVQRQLADCAAAMGTAAPDSTGVEPGIAIASTKHILVNNIPTSNAHMSTLLPVFTNVWAYLMEEKKK